MIDLASLVSWFARDDVRARLGYPGPEAVALPPLPDARDAALDPLLDRVRARGPIYRDTSPSSATTDGCASAGSHVMPA
jgi:hypothetical protein